MRVLKPVGNGAAARKYDLLTALGASALSRPPSEQRVFLRLMVAITARYNWVSDTLAVAQTDLARLWSVDERTVKRMMAEYRARGWLVLKRPAARGRVAEYALGMDTLLETTRNDWARVGTDFEARLAPAETVPPAPTVVPFPNAAVETPEGRTWPQMLRCLSARDPATARAWLSGIRENGGSEGVLRLTTKGRYQANYLRTHLLPALLAAARRVDPAIETIEITTSDG